MWRYFDKKLDTNSEKVIMAKQYKDVWRWKRHIFKGNNRISHRGFSIEITDEEVRNNNSNDILECENILDVWELNDGFWKVWKWYLGEIFTKFQVGILWPKTKQNTFSESWAEIM